MKNKLIIQNHHLIYENKEHHQKEVTDKIYKGEHWVLTNLQRRKNISTGFIKSLKLWLILNEHLAKELK